MPNYGGEEVPKGFYRRRINDVLWLRGVVPALVMFGTPRIGSYPWLKRQGRNTLFIMYHWKADTVTFRCWATIRNARYNRLAGRTSCLSNRLLSSDVIEDRVRRVGLQVEALYGD